MGFIGTLVAWRGNVDEGPEDGVADDYLFEDYESREVWSVSFVQGEFVGDGARALLEQVCAESGAPALAAFVFESDCAFVSGLDLDGVMWSGVLARDAVAELEELEPDELAERWGTPSGSAEAAAAWASAAGLGPDPTALLELFSVSESPELFLGVRLVERVLDALGLPAAAEEE